MPAIAGAALLETVELAGSPDPVDWLPIGAGLLVAAASAYACIKVFLGVVDRIGMLPFMLYRLALAAFLVWFFV